METIKSNDDISQIFESGKRLSNRYATFIALGKGNQSDSENADEHDLYGRVAFIAGKKNGNAVWRNSAKRRLREIYRANSESLDHLNILFIAKPQIMGADYSKVLTVCEQTLKRLIDEVR